MVVAGTIRRMAIVVMHKERGGRFVLLGAKASKWATSTGHPILGNWSPIRDEGTLRVAAVCGADGAIQFVDADAMRVVEVDGVPVSALLAHEARPAP